MCTCCAELIGSRVRKVTLERFRLALGRLDWRLGEPEELKRQYTHEALPGLAVAPAGIRNGVAAVCEACLALSARSGDEDIPPPGPRPPPRLSIANGLQEGCGRVGSRSYNG